MKEKLTISDSNKAELVRQLLVTGCLKLGQFTLKGGIETPYYVDLREATMSSSLFQTLVGNVERVVNSIVGINQSNLSSGDTEDSSVSIIGVPYGVVPLAAAVAFNRKLPYFPIRKEIKGYGNKTDSARYLNRRFVLIEDVMVSGLSIIETIQKLDETCVTDVIVVVDRESGGRANLKAAYPHINLHVILKASELLESTNSTSKM